jgi:hypothetical protein
MKIYILMALIGIIAMFSHSRDMRKLRQLVMPGSARRSGSEA